MLCDLFAHRYVAPEQIRRPEVTAASDIHAFSILARSDRAR